MIDFEPIVQVLRERARAGDSPAELARVLVEITKEDFRPMTFMTSFRLAFGIPLQDLQESSSWVGFGFADVDDEEFVARLGPHIESWRNSQV
jgi:hypothetical protein